MRRNGTLLVVAVLAFLVGMLVAGGPLHARGDEVTALGSFSIDYGQTRDGKATAFITGWIVRDGEVYSCLRVSKEGKHFTCEKQELAFE
jgi:hypothetical protein